MFPFNLNLNVQNYYLSRRLFARHHALSSGCRIFSSRSRSREIWLESISFFFFVYCCHNDIDFTKHYILTNFNPDQFVVKISRLKSFKAMSVWSPKNCRNNRRRYLLLLLYHACFPVLLSFGKSLYQFLTLCCFKFRLWGKEYY